MFLRTLSLFTIPFFLVAAACADEAPPSKEDEAKKDLQLMQGTWRLESFEDAGKTKVDAKKRTLFLGAELAVLREGPKVLQIGTVRLTTGKTPRRIDVAVRKGQHEDTTMLGIYELKDDTLRVCFDPEGEGRPASFEPKADTSRYVAVYKRVKRPGETVEIAGRYTSANFSADGKKTTMGAEIERRGDAYLVRWTVPGGVAYIGTGLRQGDQLSVTWANRGTVGLSVYKIEKGPKLTGEFTELGGVGIVAREELIPYKAGQVEVRLRK